MYKTIYQHKVTLLIILIGVTFTLLWPYQEITKNTSHSFEPRLETCRNKEGYWYYQILLDNRVFIKQIHVPAVEGNVFFKNRKDAEKVGQWVYHKILIGHSPSISKEELNKLQVEMN